MIRAVAIAITLAIAVQAGLGGLHGSLVFCLGGSGERPHAHAETDGGECDHQHPPGPSRSSDHEHDDFCCDDIQFTVAEVLALPGFDDAPQLAMDTAPAPFLPIEFVVARSPRGPPPWADASTAHRLAIVSSTRLTL